MHLGQLRNICRPLALHLRPPANTTATGEAEDPSEAGAGRRAQAQDPSLLRISGWERASSRWRASW